VNEYLDTPLPASQGDGICCEALRKLSTEYPAILEHSYNLLSMKDGHFLPPAWIIHLYRFTLYGRVSQRNRGFAPMNYCPFCGTRLWEEPPKVFEVPQS
jgi:hypothetical protein